MRTYQKENSDYSKQALKRVTAQWGGRFADGKLDNYQKPHYKKRIKNNSNNPRKKWTYYYTKPQRQKWNSYNKHY